MDAPDIVDDVNALLKLGVGDAYRLEHIKQSYIDNKTIWITDANYLDKMREKYLTKQSTTPLAEEPEDDEGIHCWKCGKRTPLRANFCMVCGASIFEVGTESKPVKNDLNPKSEAPRKPRNLKIPILIGIPVLILIILGGAYGTGAFDGLMKKSANESVPEPIPVDVPRQTFDPDDPNSKCGPGTKYDKETNSCVLA